MRDEDDDAAMAQRIGRRRALDAASERRCEKVRVKADRVTRTHRRRGAGPIAPLKPALDLDTMSRALDLTGLDGRVRPAGEGGFAGGDEAQGEGENAVHVSQISTGGDGA